MNKDGFLENNRGTLILFIIVAYLFSMAVRMYWPIHFGEELSMLYHGELMINTNDGYFFATGARDWLDEVTAQDAQRASAFGASPGLVLLTAYATKFLPFSLETVILYLPGIIASLIVIPIILTGRLMGNTVLGFLAALIGSVAWSYYNRTMIGYYDTDMFSVFLQFSIFYSLLHVIYKKDIISIFITAVPLFSYNYFYPQGMTIVYAVFILFVLYLIAEYKQIIPTGETKHFRSSAFSLYGSIALLGIPLMLALPVAARLILFVIAAMILFSFKEKEKNLFWIAILSFVGFLYFSNVFHVVLSHLTGYLHRGVEEEGLHFYQVVQTVREAGAIPFSTMANRISGSQIGVILSLIGYVLLVMRHKPFIIALPLIGVGVLSLWAGLRFTVYAVPVAAISVVYLFFAIGEYIKETKIKYAFVTLATAAMLYPNITHIIGYKVPTVLNLAEVQDLEKLKSISDPKDYTLSWWDYGYPIWFYSNTNTLIDGGKHNNDNFIISKIMQTSSPQFAVGLSRLSVETYVDSNYSVVANRLFKNEKKDQIDPNLLLSELENGTYRLPKGTRDIFLYLPYRMLNIFPTVAVFGNLDLTTGKPERKVTFYPTSATGNQDGIITFANGIVFDAKKGELLFGQQKKSVKYFTITQNKKSEEIGVQNQLYHADGEYCVVFMKSYGRFVVLDSKTFKSMYVQMFILGKYDKNLFELVVSSPYSRIYKIKK